VFWDRRTVPRGVDHSVQGFNPDVCINPGRMVETWKTPFDGANRTQAGRRSIGLQVLFHANYLQLAGGLSSNTHDPC